MAIVFCPVVLFCCWIIFLLLKLNDHFIQQGIRKSVYDIREIMEAVLKLMISFLYECKINLFHNLHLDIVWNTRQLIIFGLRLDGQCFSIAIIFLLLKETRE